MAYNFYLDSETMRELINNKQYDLILSYIVNQYDTGGYDKDLFLPYQEALLRDNKRELYKKTWYHFINTRTRRFWAIYQHYNANNYNKAPGGIFKIFKKQKKFIDHEKIRTEELLSIPKQDVEQNYNKYPSKQDPKLSLAWDWYELMDLIDNALNGFKNNNFPDDFKRLNDLKENIYNLKKPKAQKTTDKRKINDELFWELISESRNENDSEFVDVLKVKLEAMGASEIKKFQKHFLEKMNELYHWDIWALAYIVRRGCGDDNFDYFRAWVISKGQEVFEIVKDMQMDNFKEIFDEDPQFEEMMYIAQEAYENKQGETIPDIKVKLQKLQGKPWDEETICENYSKLCEIFEY